MKKVILILAIVMMTSSVYAAEKYNLDDFEKNSAKLIKQIASSLKQIGWRIDDIEEGDYEEDEGKFFKFYYFSLSIKGGQRINIGRKKFVADGKYDPQFTILITSVEGESEQEVWEGSATWSGRYDDFDPIYPESLVEFTCPDPDIDYFEIDDSGLKKLERMEFKVRDYKKFAEMWTKSFLNSVSRGKWRKRAVQRVALRYLESKKASQHLGELWYQNMGTKRGRTTFEVIIEWEDDKYRWDKGTEGIRRSLNYALDNTLLKFLKRHHYLPSVGELEYYPVTVRGRTKYEVIIEWLEDEAKDFNKRNVIESLDDALGNTLSKFLNENPNLK